MQVWHWDLELKKRLEAKRQVHKTDIGWRHVRPIPGLDDSGAKQDFLEFSPYYDMTEMPNNVYKNKDPFTAKIQSVKKITGEGATGETYDIVIDHGGDMPYIEGQSYGVLPPGVQENGRPHKVRLYSIASSRYGDDMTGKTTDNFVRSPCNLLVSRTPG